MRPRSSTRLPLGVVCVLRVPPGRASPDRRDGANGGSGRRFYSASRRRRGTDRGRLRGSKTTVLLSFARFTALSRRPDLDTLSRPAHACAQVMPSTGNVIHPSRRCLLARRARRYSAQLPRPRWISRTPVPAFSTALQLVSGGPAGSRTRAARSRGSRSPRERRRASKAPSRPRTHEHMHPGDGNVSRACPSRFAVDRQAYFAASADLGELLDHRLVAALREPFVTQARIPRCSSARTSGARSTA